MDIGFENGDIVFRGVECFDLIKSCTCGQAFRWRERDGGCIGVIRGRAVFLKQEGDSVRAVGASPADSASIAQLLANGILQDVAGKNVSGIATVWQFLKNQTQN